MDHTLDEIVAWLRTLPGIDAHARSGSGAVVGCRDRWVLEVQPDGSRWALAGPGGRGWRFDRAPDLERARDELAALTRAETARLTVHRLAPGEVYEVRRELVDYQGTRFSPGMHLTFREAHFLPYHGGHTIVFAEASLYLQEEEHAEILGNLDRYLTACAGGSGGTPPAGR